MSRGIVIVPVAASGKEASTPDGAVQEHDTAFAVAALRMSSLFPMALY